ncbi:transposase [Propionibacterium acidifaciens]|uniref:transposase n=1 Tax=Propionibacterium acidifaciens TaxID=556499 RepID=UPI0023F0819C|nr:transposase [Propionibacterium acidifaciens]
MAWATTQVKALLDAGWKVYTADEARPEHEAWTRRMQPPKGGSAPGRSVDRQRTSQSFFGAFSLIGKRVTLYPIEGNRNTWRTILALERLQRETEAGKIAVVLDNARFHQAKALTGLHEPGRLLERITPIHPPPYAPDHNPVEHVRNTAKSNIANIQRETPEETFGAFASYIASRTFDYDFEHLPLRETRNDFVS